MARKNLKNDATVLVIFGATGDLMKKKVVPVIYNLYCRKKLPRRFKVVAYSRDSFNSAQYQQLIREMLEGNKFLKLRAKIMPEFLALFEYHQGFFDQDQCYLNVESSLEAIDAAWKTPANKLFYLAAPPQFYEVIAKNLAVSGLVKKCADQCALGGGWVRLLMEKPFGHDSESARSLDRLIKKIFTEDQIYRIDHYLAKEMVQNILSFRFSNNLLEKSWDNRFIEKIEIRLWEKIGAEDRGAFYDDLGAFLDVGENHLLQMLSLITMDHPASFTANEIREKRAEILKQLKIPTLSEIKTGTVRAQYAGYQNIPGVKKGSQAETYFKIIGYLDAPKWQGVPIVMESGKRIKQVKKEIVVTFSHPMPCLCSLSEIHHQKNRIIFSLEPKQSIFVELWSKKPGVKFATEKRNLEFFLYRGKHKGQYVAEYEKLFLDALEGDQTLFVSDPENEASWRFADPIRKAWDHKAVLLDKYAPDTLEIVQKTAALEEALVPAEEKRYFDLQRRFRRPKELGIVGLGKMGANLSRLLQDKKWRVVGYDQNQAIYKDLDREGIETAQSLIEMARSLARPRLIWLMLPAGKATEESIFGRDGLLSVLEKGDIIIDGGNTFYKDDLRRAEKLSPRGIHYLDAGVSGGPSGARHGVSLMIGGDPKIFQETELLFYDLSVPDGYSFFPGNGAGHFVKMIHNGIEYGMMQAIAEGFHILKQSAYRLDLQKIAQVYNRGSVIESRLVGWLEKAFALHGPDLSGVSGAVGHTGEGEWTVKTAKESGLPARVIEEALKFRLRSEKNPDYAGQILSALREQFGGHKVGK